MGYLVKTLCIVQARLTSSRLPNKVVTELGSTGLTLLEHTYKRLKAIRNIDEVVFAIPDTITNDYLASFLRDKSIRYFRGDENNVLKRFYDCAVQYRPSIIVRATCDNPCVDYEEATKLIDSIGNYDYASLTNAPLGTAVEVFKADALYKAYANAQREDEQEHVTPYIYRHDEIFKILHLPYGNLPPTRIRLTVDTEQDMALIDRIYIKLYKGDIFPNHLIYDYLLSNPSLLELNSDIIQKSI